jgi:hypothetical protein
MPTGTIMVATMMVTIMMISLPLTWRWDKNISPHGGIKNNSPRISSLEERHIICSNAV